MICRQKLSNQMDVDLKMGIRAQQEIKTQALTTSLEAGKTAKKSTINGAKSLKRK